MADTPHHAPETLIEFSSPQSFPQKLEMNSYWEALKHVLVYYKPIGKFASTAVSEDTATFENALNTLYMRNVHLLWRTVTDGAQKVKSICSAYKPSLIHVTNESALNLAEMGYWLKVLSENTLTLLSEFKIDCRQFGDEFCEDMEAFMKDLSTLQTSADTAYQQFVDILKRPLPRQGFLSNTRQDSVKLIVTHPQQLKDFLVPRDIQDKISTRAADVSEYLTKEYVTTNLYLAIFDGYVVSPSNEVRKNFFGLWVGDFYRNVCRMQFPVPGFETGSVSKSSKTESTIPQSPMTNLSGDTQHPQPSVVNIQNIQINLQQINNFFQTHTNIQQLNLTPYQTRQVEQILNKLEYSDEASRRIITLILNDQQLAKLLQELELPPTSPEEFRKRLTDKNDERGAQMQLVLKIMGLLYPQDTPMTPATNPLQALPTPPATQPNATDINGQPYILQATSTQKDSAHQAIDSLGSLPNTSPELPTLQAEDQLTDDNPLYDRQQPSNLDEAEQYLDKNQSKLSGVYKNLADLAKFKIATLKETIADTSTNLKEKFIQGTDTFVDTIKDKASGIVEWLKGKGQDTSAKYRVEAEEKYIDSIVDALTVKKDQMIGAVVAVAQTLAETAKRLVGEHTVEFDSLEDLDKDPDYNKRSRIQNLLQQVDTFKANLQKSKNDAEVEKAHSLLSLAQSRLNLVLAKLDGKMNLSAFHEGLKNTIAETREKWGNLFNKKNAMKNSKNSKSSTWKSPIKVLTSLYDKIKRVRKANTANTGKPLTDDELIGLSDVLDREKALVENPVSDKEPTDTEKLIDIEEVILEMLGETKLNSEEEQNELVKVVEQKRKALDEAKINSSKAIDIFSKHVNEAQNLLYQGKLPEGNHPTYNSVREKAQALNTDPTKDKVQALLIEEKGLIIEHQQNKEVIEKAANVFRQTGKALKSNEYLVDSAEVLIEISELLEKNPTKANLQDVLEVKGISVLEILKNLKPPVFKGWLSKRPSLSTASPKSIISKGVKVLDKLSVPDAVPDAVPELKEFVDDLFELYIHDDYTTWKENLAETPEDNQLTKEDDDAGWTDIKCDKPHQSGGSGKTNFTELVTKVITNQKLTLIQPDDLPAPTEKAFMHQIQSAPVTTEKAFMLQTQSAPGTTSSQPPSQFQAPQPTPSVNQPQFQQPLETQSTYPQSHYPASNTGSLHASPVGLRRKSDVSTFKVKTITKLMLEIKSMKKRNAQLWEGRYKPVIDALNLKVSEELNQLDQKKIEDKATKPPEGEQPEPENPYMKDERVASLYQLILKFYRSKVAEVYALHFQFYFKTIRSKIGYINRWISMGMYDAIEEHLQKLKSGANTRGVNVERLKESGQSTMIQGGKAPQIYTIAEVFEQLQILQREGIDVMQKLEHSLESSLAKLPFVDNQEIALDLEEEKDKAFEHMMFQQNKMSLLYNGEMSLADMVLGAEFMFLYALKVVSWFGLWISLVLAEKLFTQKYMQKVYAEGGNAPNLLIFNGFYVAFSLVFMAVFFLILMLISYIFKNEGNSFIINSHSLQLFVADFFITWILLGLFGIILGQVIQKRRYFRYQTEGLRGVRALKFAIMFIGIIVYALPYFFIFY